MVAPLPFDALKSCSFLVGYPIHLLVDEPHEVTNVGLGEDVLPNLVDGEPLEAAGRS